MSVAVFSNTISRVWDFVGGNPVGPILGKELRVSARQRRAFFLRALYVAALTLLVMLVWYSFTGYAYYNRAYMVRQMSEAGKALLITIGIFQFIALELLSPVLTCTTISDEINHSTLNVLMTTPITSLQIVLGKLASKLLTMVLLVATSLPLLAIIRIFGGIEWRVILWLGALTLCGAVFNAALGMMFSIFSKRAYVTLLLTYFALGATYLLIPLLLSLAMNYPHGPRPIWFAIFNPFFSMGMVTSQATVPRGLMRVAYPGLSWPGWQCLFQLIGAAVLIVINAGLIRRRIRRENDVGPACEAVAAKGSSMAYRPRRVVSDHPVLWRELQVPLIADRFRRFLVYGLVVAPVLLIYMFTGQDAHDRDYQMSFTIIYMILVLLVTAVVSATVMTQEKETGALETLLATPLSVGQIVRGKAWGVLRRLLPVTVLYFGHIVLFTAFRCNHPMVLAFMVPLLLGPVLLVIGTGIFFSTWARHTTTAILLNVGLAVTLWGVIPALALFAGEITPGREHRVLKVVLIPNPMAMDGIIFEGLGGWSGYERHPLAGYFRFNMPVSGHLSLTQFCLMTGLDTFVFALCGGLALRGAERRLRGSA